MLMPRSPASSRADVCPTDDERLARLRKHDLPAARVLQTQREHTDKLTGKWPLRATRA
jgi:hypothetical protein